MSFSQNSQNTKMNTRLIAVFISLIVFKSSIAQSTLTVAEDKSYRYDFSIRKDSTKIIEIAVPNTDYPTITIRINNDIVICRDTSLIQSKIKIPLQLTQLEYGVLKLLFSYDYLVRIGNTQIMKKILKGNDSLFISNGPKGNNNKYAIPFFTNQPVKSPTISETTVTNVFCASINPGQSDTSILPYDISFLCEQRNTNTIKQTSCSTNINNPFSQLYMPPCTDKKGSAISISSGLVINTTSSDLHSAIYLVKFRKENKSYGAYQSYEVASTVKTLSPKVDRLLAVVVTAHKDSTISIDTTVANYFLDSAMAANDAYLNINKRTEPDSPTLFQHKIDTETAILTARMTATLQYDLIAFNALYSSGMFRQLEYNREMACVQSNIVKYLNLSSVPTSGKMLVDQLTALLLSLQSKSAYAKFLCKTLQVIATEYDKMLAQKSLLKTHIAIIQVPNADEFTIKIKYGVTQKKIVEQKFLVKGGWKIDFGTGVVLNGLNNSNFIQRSTLLRYRDSSNATIRDTVGQTISKNRGKINYTLGLLTHVYYRTGSYVNAGFVAGVSFNNTELTMLLGGSAMVRMGNTRLAFVGGLALGKETRLDVNHEQFEYNKSNYDANKIYVQNSSDPSERLPRFFSDTNIQSYDRLSTRWFFGISYNFASIKL
jgi:hypothetical protein